MPGDEAVVPVWTHALHYGTAVFEGIRCYDTASGPVVFRLDEHLERFVRSARLIGLSLDWTHEELREACLSAVAANGFAECYVRPLAFAGDDRLGLHAENPTRLAVIASEWPSYLGDRAREGLRATLSSWQRVGPNVIPHTAKASGLYLNAALPGRDAHAAGYDEALLFGADGTLADATAHNVFVVRDGILMTPPLSTGILPGITRATVAELAAESGIQVRETALIRADVYLADEIFVTSTATEVVPIREVDGRPIVVGPVWEQVSEKYARAVHGQIPEHRDWLTPLPAVTTAEVPPT